MEVLAILYCVSILAVGYVTNADVPDDQKTIFNVAVILIWVVVALFNIAF